MNILHVFLICLCFSRPALAASSPSVAFHYGNVPPVAELRLFDWVVVEPEALPKPPALKGSTTQWFAYVSVGESLATRSYFKKMPSRWLKGKNRGWDSHLIDQSAQDWPIFFNESIIEPLWQAGYRAFFLDTLDSWHLIAKDDAGREKQKAGLIKAIRLLKQRHPEAKLIFNRGFEVLPELHPLADAVAAESLFEGWNAGAKRYETVSTADREWLLTQLNQVKNAYRKPVIVIDYVPAKDRALRLSIAQQIKELGFIPWVSVPALDEIGLGLVRPQPRRLLMLWDSQDTTELTYSNLHRFASMPVSWFGYRLDYFDIRTNKLPSDSGARYAGAVLWSDTVKENPAFEEWLKAALRDGLPLAVLGGFGVPLKSELAALLGLRAIEDKAPYRMVEKTSLLEDEARLRLPSRLGNAVQIRQGQALLTLSDQKQQQLHPVAITPWGGYALAGFDVLSGPGEAQERWLVNPFSFFQHALRLPRQPVADITTGNGRRLVMAHVDGDGFASRAEFGKREFAGQVMLHWLKNHALPITVSVVEGEVAASGLYPHLAPQLEAVAKQIFALPQVEIASHSYSHPFKWQALTSANDTDSEGLNLPIKNYEFRLEREIEGSVDYIRNKLAPPGKPVKVFLWTGDCNPGPAALEIVARAGLLNMNGGDTIITKARPSLTAVSPPGVWKDGFYQVYAPNQNENVYTNLWRGPFYGYRAATETFELTERPRRLKPVDIYYHTYSFTKFASLKALDDVYRWVMDRPFHPVFVSDYIQMVHEFNDAAFAQTEMGWRLRLGEKLRTVRIPRRMGYPDLKRSTGIAGFSDHENERYLALSEPDAELVLQEQPPPEPYLDGANARLTHWERYENGIRFGLAGHQALQFRIGNGAACMLRHGDRAIPGKATGHFKQFEIKDHVANTLDLSCPV